MQGVFQMKNKILAIIGGLIVGGTYKIYGTSDYGTLVGLLTFVVILLSLEINDVKRLIEQKR